MICIAITAVAFGTISRSLPIGSIAYVAEVNAKCERLIWPDVRVVNKLSGLRGPGERLSDVIQRLAAGGHESQNGS
jgi:hypothetical protein